MLPLHFLMQIVIFSTTLIQVDEGDFFLESGYFVEFNCSFFPNDLAGNAHVVVNIWVINDTTQMIQQTYFGNADATNIIKTDIKNPISIFPNPIQTSFSISQDERIEKIEIYNSLGKKLKSYSWQTSYDVQFLPSDIYFVKIWTKQNELLEVLKLIKG